MLIKKTGRDGKVWVSKDRKGIRRVTLGEDDTEDDLTEDIKSYKSEQMSLSQFKHMDIYISQQAQTEINKYIKLCTNQFLSYHHQWNLQYL